MSEYKRPEGNETFQQKLKRLRMGIDLLPAEQRPHLFELADIVQQQYQSMYQQGGQQGNAAD